MPDEKQEEKKEIAGQNGQDLESSGGNTESELEKLKKQCEEYLNGWKRAKADFINYQKDEGKRFEEMINYSREMVISDFVPILDSMELALKAEPQNDGLQRIKIQLEDSLKKYGLEKIKVSPGDSFDTNLHESIGEMEIPSASPSAVSSGPNGSGQASSASSGQASSASSGQASSASSGQASSASSGQAGKTHSINSGQVAAEVSSGYKLKNKVIRPVRVKLSK